MTNLTCCVLRQVFVKTPTNIVKLDNHYIPKETDLRDMLAKNLETFIPGLKLLQMEYMHIDILARDVKQDCLVIIELKKRNDRNTATQVADYYSKLQNKYFEIKDELNVIDCKDKKKNLRNHYNNRRAK